MGHRWGPGGLLTGTLIALGGVVFGALLYRVAIMGSAPPPPVVGDPPVVMHGGTIDFDVIAPTPIRDPKDPNKITRLTTNATDSTPATLSFYYGPGNPTTFAFQNNWEIAVCDTDKPCAHRVVICSQINSKQQACDTSGSLAPGQGGPITVIPTAGDYFQQVTPQDGTVNPAATEYQLIIPTDPNHGLNTHPDSLTISQGTNSTAPRQYTCAPPQKADATKVYSQCGFQVGFVKK